DTGIQPTDTFREITMSPLLLFFVLAVVNGQHHAEHLGGVTCYDCHGPHKHFPDCLQTTRTCDVNQVCEVKTGGAHPEIMCRDKSDCTAEIDHAAADCAGGESCKHIQCCEDAACVTSITNLISTSLFYCPADCTGKDLSSCTNHECSGDQHCEQEVAEKHCGRGHDCTTGCCKDSSCINTAFGATSGTTNPLGTLSCSDLANVGCGVLDAVCPKIHCPALCDACINPIVQATTTAMPTSTPAPAVQSTVIGITDLDTCRDELEGLDCQMLPDVCSSTVLAHYCRAHCEMC
ncbi:hypothetical protein BaRGS_00034944, partial [Batillaria attramentaria]